MFNVDSDMCLSCFTSVYASLAPGMVGFGALPNMESHTFVEVIGGMTGCKSIHIRSKVGAAWTA